MPGLRATLPTAMTFADDLPFREKDPLLTHGSLVLFDPSHPRDPCSGTAIAQTQTGTNYGAATHLPNLAARPAAALIAPVDFTATASFANNIMTVTAVNGGGTINLGDELYTAGGVLIGRVASCNSGTGGNGTYSVWPAPGAIAATDVTVHPSLKPMVRRNYALVGGVEQNFKTEWTAKGALHVASTRLTAANTCFLSIELPSAVRQYMRTNPAHEYYFSMLYELTRAANSNAGPYADIGKNANGSGWLQLSDAGVQLGVMHNQELSTGARGVPGLIHEHFSNSYHNVALASAADMLGVMFGFGMVNGAFGDHGKNKSMSAVVRRIYGEDRTVSGRTHAQVRDLDVAIRQAATAPGKRMHGDVWTDPAVLLP